MSINVMHRPNCDNKNHDAIESWSYQVLNNLHILNVVNRIQEDIQGDKGRDSEFCSRTECIQRIASSMLLSGRIPVSEKTLSVGIQLSMDKDQLTALHRLGAQPCNDDSHWNSVMIALEEKTFELLPLLKGWGAQPDDCWSIKLANEMGKQAEFLELFPKLQNAKLNNTQTCQNSLTIAVENEKDEKKISELIQSGAQPCKTDRFNTLTRAFRHQRSFEIIKQILDAGGQFCNDLAVNKSIYYNDGNSLQTAFLSDHYDDKALLYFINRGAIPNRFCLHLAIQQGCQSLELYQALLEKGDTRLLEPTQRLRTTAHILDEALKQHLSPEIIQLLIRKGAYKTSYSMNLALRNHYPSTIINEFKHLQITAPAEK